MAATSSKVSIKYEEIWAAEMKRRILYASYPVGDPRRPDTKNTRHELIMLDPMDKIEEPDKAIDRLLDKMCITERQEFLKDARDHIGSQIAEVLIPENLPLEMVSQLYPMSRAYDELLNDIKAVIQKHVQIAKST